MRVAKFLPFVALAAVLGSLLVTAVWHESLSSRPPYESPCILSWEENDGDSTFCILTQKAAAEEHRLAREERS